MKPLFERIYLILCIISTLIVIAFIISLSKLMNALRLVLARARRKGPCL